MKFFGIEERDGMVRIPGPVSMPNLDYTEIDALVAALDAKLDEADYTAADVLAKLLTVDGAGSGIDADLLDGQSSAAFSTAVHTHPQSDITGLVAALAAKLDAASYTAADVLSKLLTVDGAGSGLDADLLDGISSAGFVAAASYTAADVLAKLLTVDGSGSGLDADLLDGLSSASFLQTSSYQALAPTWTNAHTFSRASDFGTPTILLSSARPVLMFTETDVVDTDAQKWGFQSSGGVFECRAVDASAGTTRRWLGVTRSGVGVTDLTFGNTTDNPTYTFSGTGTATYSGQVTALRFVPTSSTVATNGLYLPSSNNPALSANSTKVIDWTSTLVTITGNVSLGTAGNKLLVKEGTNASMGVATLVAGTVTVNTTLVTASSRIFLTVQSLGTVAVATPIAVTARTAGTSFTITSSAITDTSVVAWHIVEPA